MLHPQSHLERIDLAVTEHKVRVILHRPECLEHQVVDCGFIVKSSCWSVEISGLVRTGADCHDIRDGNGGEILVPPLFELRTFDFVGPSLLDEACDEHLHCLQFDQVLCD